MRRGGSGDRCDGRIQRTPRVMDEHNWRGHVAKENPLNLTGRRGGGVRRGWPSTREASRCVYSEYFLENVDTLRRKGKHSATEFDFTDGGWNQCRWDRRIRGDTFEFHIKLGNLHGLVE